MAYPSKIKIGIIDSIKVDNYQYKKPSIEVEVTLNPGDSVAESVNNAKDKINKIMKQWKLELTPKAPDAEELPY